MVLKVLNFLKILSIDIPGIVIDKFPFCSCPLDGGVLFKKFIHVIWTARMFNVLTVSESQVRYIRSSVFRRSRELGTYCTLYNAYILHVIVAFVLNQICFAFTGDSFLLASASAPAEAHHVLPA